MYIDFGKDSIHISYVGFVFITAEMLFSLGFIMYELLLEFLALEKVLAYLAFDAALGVWPPTIVLKVFWVAVLFVDMVYLLVVAAPMF